MARILGLDIDTHTVRAVLVRSSFGRVEPLRYLEAPIHVGDPPPAAPPDQGPPPSDGGAFGGGAFGAEGHETPPESGQGFGATQGFGSTQGFGTPEVGFGAPPPGAPSPLGSPPPAPDAPRAPALEPSGSGLADTLEPEGTGAEPVPADPDDELTPRDRARRRAIEAIVAQITPPPEQVVAGLDGKEASLRILELPAGVAKKAGKIAEVLPFQLDDLVPFDIEETIVDHQVIGTDGPTIRVLATAVPKTTVAHRLHELKAVGVDPMMLPVGAAALDGLTALVPTLAEGGPFLVLEVEGENTEICILEGGICTYARSMAMGQEELVDPRKKLQVIGAFKRSLGAYRASGGRPLERAFLCGEGIQHAGSLGPFLSENVLDGTLVESLPMPEAEGADEYARPRFARAAGLAGHAVVKGKRIDLRKGEFAKRGSMGLLRTHGRLMAICAAAIFLSFIFATWARWSVLGDEQEELRDRLASVTEELFSEGTRSAEQARELLEGGSSVVDPLPTMTAFDVLDAITDSIPGEITHDTRRLDIEVDDVAREGRFELQGTVASIAERDTIKAKLEEHDCFTEVDPGPTSPGPGNEGLNYRLEVTIKCPGDEPLTPDDDRGGRRRGRS